MTDYDQTSRYAAKRIDPAGFLRWLLGDGVPLAFRQWSDTRAVVDPGGDDRTGDAFAHFTDPTDPDRPVAVLVEFQTANDAEVLERTLEEIAHFRRELRRLGFRVCGAVVNLTGPPQPDTLAMDLPGLPDIGLRLKVVLRTLRDEDAAATLGAIATGAVARCVLPWVPLMRGGAEQGTIDLWRQLASAEPDPNHRADYGMLAGVFARLLPPAAAQAWAEALKEWNVEKSPLLEEIRAREREVSLARGRTEGRAEGVIQGRREALLQALQLRFQAPVPEDLTAAINGLTDPAEFDRWFAAVFAAPSIADYRRAVGR
jgi:hypothetical protein